MRSYQPTSSDASFSNLYQLLTTQDPKKDFDSIIDVLDSIAEKRVSNQLRVITYYKETPVNLRAVITSIDRGVVEVAIPRIQAASMLNQTMAFIKSKHLPRTVIAKILEVSVEDRRAFLSQFSYVILRAERRLYVRVRLSSRFEAEFSTNLQTISGTIRDISIGGVAIRVLKGQILTENVRGMATLKLANTKLHVPGKLVRIQDEDKMNIYAIEFDTNNRTEMILSKFVFEQHRLILKELKYLKENSR